MNTADFTDFASPKAISSRQAFGLGLMRVALGLVVIYHGLVILWHGIGDQGIGNWLRIDDIKAYILMYLGVLLIANRWLAASYPSAIAVMVMRLLESGLKLFALLVQDMAIDKSLGIPSNLSFVFSADKLATPTSIFVLDILLLIVAIGLYLTRRLQR